MMQNLNWRLAAEIVGGALFVLLLIWFFFLRQASGLAPAQTAQQQTFAEGDARAGIAADTGDNANQAQSIQSPISKQKVFKITDGPVAGAAFAQQDRPTTTIARFVLQQNGHVLDLPIDSPGAVSRAASNTTIPGAQDVTWEMQTAAGRQTAAGAILRYLDNATVKSVLLGFPPEGTTTLSLPAPVRIQFLPNDLSSIAPSPDGLSLAYLVATADGSDIYTARADGTSPKKVASLPLSQVILSWPSQGTLLAVSKAATGVPGIAFSVSASSGAISPILYAAGLTATADPSFSYVVYQSAPGTGRNTYVHNIRSGFDRSLSFDPIPEKCIWSQKQIAAMYCAVPLSYVQPNFLDLWHMGAASAADSIVKYDLISGRNTVIATPGGNDGGVASDVLQLALSADEKYLLFVTKGARSVWGVRL